MARHKKKSIKRLQIRQEDFKQIRPEPGYKYHLPGSQNRKK